MIGNAKPWSSGDWALDLGILDVHGHQLRLAYALRKPPEGAAMEVRAFTQSSIPVLLLPAGLDSSTGLAEILLEGPLPDLLPLRRDIVKAANLSDQVPALALAPPNARLVVDSVHGRIWFDGIEVTALKPETQPFRFVEILARSSPKTINKHELANKLSHGRGDGDQGARSAKTAACKCIRAAVKAGGRTFEDPFKSEAGSYRLTVPSFAR